MNNDKDTVVEDSAEEMLEVCDVCDNRSVVINGRCKTCMECGNSMCSI